MLVAIAIPVFTSQLEKSRESTDVANIRSAYAEVVTQFLQDPDATNPPTITVDAQQKQQGNQSGTLVLTVQGAGSQTEYDLGSVIGATNLPKSYTVTILQQPDGSAVPSVKANP